MDSAEYKELQIAFGNAIQFAVKKHAGQTTRDGMPYILHPIAVSNRFSIHEIKEKIVAVLHDVLEDTDTTEQDIIDNITSDHEILFALDCLSHRKEDSYEAYIVNMICRSQLAIAVKIKDIEHNMDITRLPEITRRSLENIQKYHQWRIYLIKESTSSPHPGQESRRN